MTTTDLSSSPAHPTQTATQEKDERSSVTPPKQQQQEEYLFSCRCDSAKAVSSLLSCLTTPSDKRNHTTIQPVTVFCTPTALTFHVYGTTAKQSQASVDIQRGLFCDYQACSQGEFCVNLTQVLTCLSILGTFNHHTKLCWAYSPSTSTFEMELLEQGGVLSTAAIPGLLVPSSSSSSTSLALAFSQTPIVSRILLKSDWLKQAWSELEHVPGATVCTVAVSNTALQLATVGNHGECIVSLPATTRHTQGSVLLSLECNSRKCIPRSYPWKSLQLGFQGLDIAQETCLTMNEAGMMAIQHQVFSEQHVGNGDANFVDFLMACLQDDEEQQEQEGNQHQQQQQQDDVPLSLGWKSQEQDNGGGDKSQQNSDDDDSDSDDSHALPPPISSAPLFGTVVDDTASVSTSNTTRNVRRRRHSSVLLSGTAPSSSMRGEGDDSSEQEEEEEEPLDVTATSTPNRRRRRRRRGRGGGRREEEGASSPEIGYGDDDYE